MSPSELCEVVITARDPEWLKDFSRKLVEDQLACSAHNFAPVRSVSNQAFSGRNGGTP